MAYLKGDVIKVPAHWSSPGSYLYMEAQTDVPQGLTLAELFDSYVGSGGYFDYVGQDRSNGAAAGGKPTTDFVRANVNLAEPDTHIAGDIPSLVSLMAVADSPNNYTPGFVKVGDDIYEANHDWGVKTWNSKNSFKEGDLFFDSANSSVKYVTSNVKGTYTGAAADTGNFVTYQGEWYKATTSAAASDVPPAHTNAVSLSTATIHKSGDVLRYATTNNGVSVYALFTASSLMKGTNSSTTRASAVSGDVLASIGASGAVYYVQ